MKCGVRTTGIHLKRATLRHEPEQERERLQIYALQEPIAAWGKPQRDERINTKVIYSSE